MKEKKEVYKVKPLTEGKKNIIANLIEEYDIKTTEDIQEALKDLLGGTIKSMLEAEMNEHILVMKNINILMVPIIIMTLKRKMFVLLMVSFKLIFHKIEILLLTPKLLKRDKKIFLRLTKKS